MVFSFHDNLKLFKCHFFTDFFFLFFLRKSEKSYRTLSFYLKIKRGEHYNTWGHPTLFD